MANASSFSSTVSVVSNVIGSRARYHDRRRQSIPSVVANDYVAIVETRPLYFEEQKSPYLEVPSSNTDWNDIFTWSPIITIGPFLNESLPLALYNAYEYYRIRCVKIRLTPDGMFNPSVGAMNENLNLVNTSKTPVFIWEPQRSSAIGAVPKNFLGPTYVDMLESGEKFYKIANSKEDTLTMEVVPQCWNSQNLIDPDGANIYPSVDIPAPWIPTTEPNKGFNHYVPFFVWKLLYSGPGPNTILTNKYSVIVKVCIEFKDAKSSEI